MLISVCINSLVSAILQIDNLPTRKLKRPAPATRAAAQDDALENAVGESSSHEAEDNQNDSSTVTAANGVQKTTKKVRKTYERRGWMVDEGESEDDFDYGQKEDPMKDWKVEKIPDNSSTVSSKHGGRERQVINRKTRGFAVTEMILNDLKRETAAAKQRNRKERAAAEAEGGDDSLSDGDNRKNRSPGSVPKLTGKAKRAQYNAEKIKRIGTHYYETANVKNRNRDRVKTVDSELGNRGHMKKKPTKGR